jgi:hypothetical protein
MKLSIDILNKRKGLFSKTEDRRVKQVLSGGFAQVGVWRIRKGYRKVNMVEV